MFVSPSLMLRKLASAIQSAISTPVTAVLAILSIVGSSPTMNAQNRNEWKSFSAVNAVQSMAFSGDSVLWIATTGGVVAYHTANDSIEIYRNTEGLMALNATAIAVDSSDGNVYIGGADGSLSIRMVSGEWAYSSAISSATSYFDRRITGFGFRDGRVYILTAFGGVVYNPHDSVITDNFVNIGSIPRNTPVNDILFWNGWIWLATDGGIARTPIDNDNLAARERWQVFESTTKLAVTSLTVVDDQLFVGTRNDALWKLVIDADTLERRFDIEASGIVFSEMGENSAGIDDFHVYRLRDHAFRQITTTADGFTSVAVSSIGQIAVGLKSTGFDLLRDDTLDVKLPNAPLSNRFTDIAIADDGSVWAAHRDFGVSRMSENQWGVFTVASTGLVGLNSTAFISAGANGTIWAGSEGKGLNLFATRGSEITTTHYDSSNAPIVPSSNPRGYMIISQAAADPFGRTWIVQADVSNGAGPALMAKLRDDEGVGEIGGFIGFIPPNSGGVTPRNYATIAIDDAGTKWLGGSGFNTQGEKGRGLCAFNDRGTLNDISDDVWRFITTNDDLPDDEIDALAIDPDGLLWIGTRKGLTILVNPISCVENPAVRPDFHTVSALKDIPVTSIAVDALNRKWIGTLQGVFLLNIDGTTVLEHYTVDNSPLVNNEVNAIQAVDATGDIYIGTANGLSRISTEAVRPSGKKDGITVSPQPFLLPPEEPLKIVGLPERAVVKVLTLSGSLVREVPSPGGAIAFWDGMDQSGAFVPTGVYLIAAGSGTGNDTVVGKVAVIRR